MPKFWKKLEDPEYVQSLKITRADLRVLTNKALNFFDSDKAVEWAVHFFLDDLDISQMVAILVKDKEKQDEFAVFFLYHSIMKLPEESSSLVRLVRKELKTIRAVLTGLVDKRTEITALVQKLSLHRKDSHFREAVSDFMRTMHVSYIAREGNQIRHAITHMKRCDFLTDLKALIEYTAHSEYMLTWKWVLNDVMELHYKNLESSFDRDQLKTKEELINAIRNVSELNYDVLVAYHADLYRCHLSPYYALVSDHEDVKQLERDSFYPHFVEIFKIHREVQDKRLNCRCARPLENFFFLPNIEDAKEVCPEVADNDVAFREEFAQMGIDDE